MINCGLGYYENVESVYDLGVAEANTGSFVVVEGDEGDDDEDYTT
jgi:hypothetical protein